MLLREICIWPDNTWCFVEDLEEYQWKSDDYSTYEIPDEWDDTDIEIFVEQQNESKGE